MLASAHDGGLDPGRRCRRHRGGGAAPERGRPDSRLDRRGRTAPAAASAARGATQLVGGEGRRDARRLGARRASTTRRRRRSGYLSVSVLESHRRRGIGTALLERALAHLDDSTRIQASATEAGRGFAERYGFRQTHTRRVSGVDPRTVDTERARLRRRRGSRPCCEVGPEQIFDVDAESVLDEPGDDPIDAVEYDQWLRDYWEHPDLDLELSRAAVVDGQSRRRGLRHGRRRVAPRAQCLHRLASRLSRPWFRPARQARR